MTRNVEYPTTGKTNSKPRSWISGDPRTATNAIPFMIKEMCGAREIRIR
jgi:hypothetical protein